VISGLRLELQPLRTTDPGMTFLSAVEFMTADPGGRVVLYRLSSLRIATSDSMAWVKTTLVF
jgi:hypothetical protein